MLQPFILLLLIVTPALASAQFIKAGTSKYKKIVKEQCDERIFTKTEEPVSFTISKQALEDSLTSYLKAKQVFDPNAAFSVQFIVTRESQIIDVIKLRGTRLKKQFVEALQQFSNLLKPAKQNNHDVCSFVKYDVEVKQNRLVLAVVVN